MKKPSVTVTKYIEKVKPENKIINRNKFQTRKSLFKKVKVLKVIEKEQEGNQNNNKQKKNKQK